MIYSDQAEAVEEVELELLPHQFDAWEATEPELCLCTGLGGGKTKFGAWWLISRAEEEPYSVHLATANTHSQLEDVVVPALQDAADDFGIPWRYHQTRKILFLDLGDVETQIWCRGLENPQKALRGPEFASWWGDEVRDYSPAAITVCDGRIRCNKAARRRKLWTTTPNGFDHIYNRFVEEAKPGIHRMIRAKTGENWHLPTDYLETLEREYDEFMLRQEAGGEFVNLVGGALYYTFDRDVHITDRVALLENVPLVLCFDQNPDPLTCELIQELPDETWSVDEIVIQNGNLDLVDERLRALLEDRHSAGIIIAGDAVIRQKSAGTGKAFFEEVRERLEEWYPATIKIDVPKQNPPIVDRVASVCNRLRNARGLVRWWISPRCKELRLDLEQVRPIKGARAPDGSKDHARTHASDACGYWIVRKHGVGTFRSSLEDLKRLGR